MTTPKTFARATGLLYLIVAAGGLFAITVRNRIVEPGNAAATADNIRASAGLFRAGFFSELVASVLFLATVMALYLLLKHVHQLVAAAMITIVAVSVAIACLNLLNWYTALSIATSDTYPRTFGTAGADALTMLYLDAYGHGGRIAYIFFALWLVPLGYLVIRSGDFPKVLGIALIVGCFGYLAGAVTALLAPDAPAGVLTSFGAVGGLPELAFLAWLLVKGVPATAGDAPVPATPNQPQSVGRGRR